MLLELNNDLALFTHTILNRAEYTVIHRGYRRAVRELRLHNPNTNYADDSDLSQVLSEVSTWLIDRKAHGETLTTGRKKSRLARWEAQEALTEQQQYHNRFQSIQREFDQLKATHRPPRRNVSFNESLKSKWREQYLARVEYHDLPLEIFERFVDGHTASEIAWEVVSRKYAISVSHLKQNIFPKVTTPQDLPYAKD
ncbi:MAG: hypothetical protein ACJ74W_16840 [Pyrinomonadaceae bacterium]